MRFVTKFITFFMIYARLLQNLVIEIYALFLLIFLGRKIVLPIFRFLDLCMSLSLKLSSLIFWMLACSKELWKELKSAFLWHLTFSPFAWSFFGFLRIMERVGKCWSLTPSSPTSRFFGSLTWNPDLSLSPTQSGIFRASQALAACSSPGDVEVLGDWKDLLILVVTSSVMVSRFDVTQAGSGPSYGWCWW